MRLIDPSFEIIPQAPGIEGAWAMAAKAARTCYLSEKTRADETEEQFCRRLLLKSHNLEACHLTPLEHGTVYLYLEVNADNAFKDCPEYSDLFTAHYNWSDVVGRLRARYDSNPYSKVVEDYQNGRRVYITTNLRVMLENGWLRDLQFCIPEPLPLHAKRVSVRCVIDRAVAMEFVRHRAMSFCMESQRYCNYSKDKFGKEITFIDPSWSYEVESPEDPVKDGDYFTNFLINSEENYFKLLELGWRPEQARVVLPNATKTTLFVTAFVSDWKHFFKLRADGISGEPYSEVKRIAQPLQEEFKKNGY